MEGKMRPQWLVNTCHTSPLMTMRDIPQEKGFRGMCLHKSSGLIPKVKVTFHSIFLRRKLDLPWYFLPQVIKCNLLQ